MREERLGMVTDGEMKEEDNDERNTKSREMLEMAAIME